MVELYASIELNEWFFQQEVKESEFLGFVGHREKSLVYGGLFQTEKGLVFQQHKWSEVNKNKPKPKVCAETKYSAKFVSDEIWNSFKKLTNPEYLSRYVEDMQSC